MPDAAAPPAYPTCNLADLSPGETSVLEAIVESKWGWVARIYFVLKQREADVATLASRGLVARVSEELAAAMSQHAPEGDGVILTPYAAHILGVELVPCVSRSGSETDRSRWERIKLDVDGERLRERKGKGAKVPRSFRSLHITHREAEAIVDGADGPEYLVDEFNGEVILCYQGGATVPAIDPTSPAAILLGGTGKGPATRGIPILRDKRIRGKK